MSRSLKFRERPCLSLSGSLVLGLLVIVLGCNASVSVADTGAQNQAIGLAERVQAKLRQGRILDAVTEIEEGGCSYYGRIAGRQVWRWAVARPELAMEALDERASPAALLLMGELQSRLGNADAARDSTRRAWALAGDALPLLCDPSPAEGRYGDALWSAPTFSHRDNWILRRLLSSGLRGEAEECYRRVEQMYAARSDRFARQLVVERAAFLLATGGQEEALDSLEGMILAQDLEGGLGAQSSEPLHDLQQGFPGGGLSVNTFVQLAHGLFALCGEEERMVAAVDRAIVAGATRLLPIRALLHLRSGLPETALSTWRRYLDGLKLDPVSYAFRLASVAEELGDTELAVVELERIVALLSAQEAAGSRFAGLELPAEGPGAMVSEAILEASVRGRESGLDPSSRPEIVALARVRLVRQYRATGRGEDAAQLMLERASSEAGLLAEIRDVRSFVERLTLAGRGKEAEALVRGMAESTPDRFRQAALWCGLGEADRALDSVSDLPAGGLLGYLPDGLLRCLGEHRTRGWLLQWPPENAVGLGNWFGVVRPGENLGEEERLRLLERAVEIPQPDGRGPLQHHVAALLTLYRKQGAVDRMVDLGLTLLEGKAPFVAPEPPTLDDNHRWSRGRFAFRECVAMLLWAATKRPDGDALIARIERALVGFTGLGLLEQACRLQSKPTREVHPPVPWSPPLPQGVTVLTSPSDVRSLAADERLVYAGTSWGLAVFDHHGTPLRNVLVGAPVNHVLPYRDRLWLGTDQGLYEQQIDGGSSPTRILFAGAEHESRRAVSALTTWNGRVWFSSRSLLCALDPAATQAQCWLLGTPDSYEPSTGRVRRLVADGDLLWVEHDRYDSATARWVAVPDLDGHQVTVVGAAPAAVVGWVDRLERVCVVDRRTLRATLVEGPLADAPTSPPIVTGHDDSTIFLRSTSGGVWYALDTDERRLSAFRTSALPRLPWGSPALLDGREYLGFDRGWATHPNSRVAGFHGVITPLSAIGTPQIVIGEHFWFASSWSRANGFVYTQASESSPRRLFGPAGGLYRLSLATGELEQLAPRFDGHTLADETVVVALEDCTPNSDTVHLVGRHGVSRLLVDGRVEEWSTYADGLATDWLFAATCVNGRLVVWSDRDSGRGPEERAAASVLEPGSGLWMPFASPGSLRRDGGSFAAWLDLEDRAVHLPALPKFERDPCRDSGVCMPVLGGIERGRLSIGDQVLRYGNHGAVLAPESLQVELLTAPSRSVLAPGIDWRSRAHRARAAQYGQVRSPAELAPYLADANPFVQAEGVSRIHPMFLDESFRPLLERCVRSTCPRLQYTALVELGKLPAEGSADLYYDLVGGEDPRAKAWAAVKLGELLMPGIDSILRDLVDAGVDLDPWPYGSTGDQKTGFRYHLALALRRYRCADDLTRILPLLPVFARPEFEDIASEVIRDPRLPWSLLERVDNPPIGWITLAGPDALPLLHHAVASRDRIVRANAARCLADLRDPSSVGPLLQALEQPSGLARREIVVALGKLRAREAMPALVDLYRAVEDEHRPGVMASQVMARTVGEMEGLNSLSELSSGLDAFGLGGSRSLATDQVCPKGFQLLDLRCILEAAVMIGGRGSAELFALAAAGSAPDRSSLRLLAARGLDLPSEEQSPEAAAVLRALLQDDDSGVAVAAAVSLLNCGSTEGMRVLEHEVERAVSIDHPLGAVRVLEEMLRVRDPAHLDPFLDLALALRAQPDDRLDSRRYVIHRFIAKTR